MNQEFWAEIEALIKPIPELNLEYRLHYNDNGDIYLCTMQDHPKSTQYLVVDKSTYINYHLYRVVNGKLETINSDSKYRVRLTKSTTGYAVVKGHAGLLIEPTETFNEIEYYARNN